MKHKYTYLVIGVIIIFIPVFYLMTVKPSGVRSSIQLNVGGPKSQVATNDRMSRIYTIGPNDVSFIMGGGKVIVGGADPDSFQLLGLCVGEEPYELYYGKDGSRVYCGASVVDGADPDTFEVLGTFIEKDPVGDYPNNFGIAKDKECFYHGKEKVTDENGRCLSELVLKRYY